MGEEKNEYLENVEMQFSQGCYKTTLDKIIFKEGLEKPHHIKIDVDGIEHLVIRGASTIIRNRIPKTLNVEVNSKIDEHHDMLKYIEDCGYSVKAPNLKKLRNAEDKSKALCNVLCYRN